MANQQQVQIAAKLYECRQIARMIGKEKYAEQVIPWMQAVIVSAALKDVSRLQAGQELAAAESPDGNFITAIWMLAATVELIEPDEQTPEVPNG